MRIEILKVLLGGGKREKQAVYVQTTLRQLKVARNNGSIERGKEKRQGVN